MNLSSAHELRFNSAKTSGYQDFSLACGFISTNIIHFEVEQIVAVVEAKGDVAFYDTADTLLASGSATAPGGRGRYADLRCRVAGGKIILEFPIYEWYDNYPHCDGEYDRWDTKIIGYLPMTFDLESKTIV